MIESFSSKTTILILHIVLTAGKEIKSKQNFKEHGIRFFRSLRYWANDKFVINFPENRIRSNTNSFEYL